MFNPYSKELLCEAKKIDMSKFCDDIWKMMQHEKRGDFMYESPITTYIDEIINQQMVERENAIIIKVSETIGIDVNREKLIKALNYDRQQYEKGYADAKAEYESMIDKIRSEIDKLPDLNPDYEMDKTIHVSKWSVFDIIDKYKAESEVDE